MPREIDRLTISFRGDLQALNASVKQANSTIERFERAVNKRAARINTAFQAIGKAVRSALVPAALLIGARVLLGVLSAPIRAFREFETGLVEVGKVANVAGLELTDLGQRVEALGTGGIPIASKQLLEIAATAARLGVRGTENIQRFTAAVGGLTLATDVSSGPGATNLARLLNITDEPVSNIEKVSSAIVHLGNNYATTESTILDFALQLAAQTSAYGLAAQDILGLAGAFSSFSTRAERSGTAVGQFFSIMNSLVRGNSTRLREISELAGVTVDQFRQVFSKNQVDAFQLVLNGLNNVIETGGDARAVLGRFGIDGRRAISELTAAAKRSDLVADTIRDSRKAYRENIALYQEVARGAATLDSRIKILKNSFSAFVRQGAPGDFLKGATDFLSDILNPRTLGNTIRNLRAIETSLRKLDELRSGRGRASFFGIDTGPLSPDLVPTQIRRFTKNLEDAEATIKDVPTSSLRVFFGQTANQAEDLAERLGISAEAVDRYRRQIRGLATDGTGQFQAITSELREYLDVEKLLEDALSARVRDTGDEKFPGLAGDEIRQSDDALNGLLETAEKYLANQRALRVAISQSEEAYLREIAAQKAKRMIEKEGVLTVDPEKLARLTELLYQQGLAAEAHKREAAELARLQREQKRTAEAIRQLGADQARTTAENNRLLDALQTSHEAYKETKRLIDAENVARRLGITLKSEEAQAIIRLELANAELNDRVQENLDEFKRQEAAVEEIKDSVKDFAASATTDFDSIGDHFRALTNRIFRLWYDNVVDRIFARAGFEQLLSGFASALAGGVPGPAAGAPLPSGLVDARFAAGRAQGGPVFPGRLYRVNEGGRSETFLSPQQRGYILPARDTRELVSGAASRAGGINVYQNISVNTQVSGDEDLNRKLAATADIAAANAMASFKKQISSGGELRRLVGSV